MNTNTKATSALASILATARAYDTIEVNIFLRGEPAAHAGRDIPGAAAENRAATVERMRSQVDVTQRGLIEFLSATAGESVEVTPGLVVPKAVDITALWVTNTVTAKLTPDVVRLVLDRDDVQSVDVVRTVRLDELLDTTSASADARAVNAAAAVPPSPTWSVQRIKAPLLWRLGINGAGVVVAVIDTGVTYTHPDLAAQMWDGGPEFPCHGYDFANDDVNPVDESGHGTSSAGIVAGNGESGTATGVAPKATVMALRVGGRENSYWQAFEFAVEHGATVISMSMSWKHPHNPSYTGWRRACEAVAAAGVLHANSVGNEGISLLGSPIPHNIATPGNCPPPRVHPLQDPVGGVSSVIGCGATDAADRLAQSSSRGPAAWDQQPFTDYPYVAGSRAGLIKPDLCAPGPGTTSCNWRYTDGAALATPYSGYDGTSAATPHVAGSLALLAHACTEAGSPVIAARLQEALESTAIRIVGQTRAKQDSFGAGRIDVYAAYAFGRQRQWW